MHCHLWAAPVLQEFPWVPGSFSQRSFVRPVCAVHIPAGPPFRDISAQYPVGQWMKSVDPFPIKLTGCEVLAMPRGVPIAAALIIVTSIALASGLAADVLSREVYVVRYALLLPDGRSGCFGHALTKTTEPARET